MNIYERVFPQSSQSQHDTAGFFKVLHKQHHHHQYHCWCFELSGEGKDLNYISFSHVNDVRPPVNTPDGDSSQQLCACCPEAPQLTGRKYPRLLRWDQHQNTVAAPLQLEKLAHCYVNWG